MAEETRTPDQLIDEIKAAQLKSILLHLRN